MQLSRRQFLGATGAFALAPNIWAKGRVRDEAIIIGAGLAGLAAARELKAQDVPFTIIEGAMRPGGRVFTDGSLGSPIDLGAGWIHGPKGNPITDVFTERGGALEAFDGTKLSLRKGRQPLEQDAIDTYEALYAHFQEFSEGYRDRATDTASLRDGLNEYLKGARPSLDGASALRWYVGSEMENTLGANLKDLSARYWNTEESFQGTDLAPKPGLIQLVNWLAEGMPVKYGEVVKQIDYAEDSVKVTTSKGVYQAARVIVTLPLGVLKSGGVVFNPPLSDRKIKALQRIGNGAHEKIVLLFDRVYWPLEFHRFGSLTPPEEPSVVEIWNYAEMSNTPALVLESAGAGAKTWATLTPEAARAAALAHVRKTIDADIPEPEKVVRSDWASRIFSKGAYSYLPPGATPGDFDALAAREKTVHFAGEHTSRAYFGTMHGAFLSGKRAAQEVISPTDAPPR